MRPMIIALAFLILAGCASSPEERDVEVKAELPKAAVDALLLIGGKAMLPDIKYDNIEDSINNEFYNRVAYCLLYGRFSSYVSVVSKGVHLLPPLPRGKCPDMKSVR